MGIKQGGIAAVLAAAVLVLAGCDGVGDGAAPDPKTARVDKRIGTASFGPTKIFTCVPQQLDFTMDFTNGGRENFNERSTWTSSNRDIAVVTKSGAPVYPAENDPETGQPLLYTVSGVVLPRAPGEVTLTADFKGVRKSITMTVQDPDSPFRIQAVEYGDPLTNSINMNHNTIQQLRLVGTLDGYETDLASALSEMSFDNPEQNEGAPVNFVSISGQATSIIQAVKDTTKTGTRTARAKLVACPDSNNFIKDTKLDVTVKAATGLLVRRELDTPVNGNVLAFIPDSTSATTPLSQTTEVLRAYATFDGGSEPEQDLSTQVLASSSKPEIISVNGLLIGSSGTGAIVPTAIQARSTGTGTTPPQLSEDVTLSFCQVEPTPDPKPNDYVSKCWEGKPTAASIVFKARRSTLTDITVTPVDAEIEAFKRLQFRAVGSFDGGFQQDITRHVVWEAFANDGTTRSTKVGIGSVTTVSNVTLPSLLGGTAISAFQVNTDTDDSNGTPLQDRTVKIKATNERATVTKTQTVTATLSK